MDFDIIELPYSQIADSSNLIVGSVDKNIKFRNLNESKGTRIVIEDTPTTIKTIMLYNNGFILYTEQTPDYCLIRTNKEIQEDSEGLFIQF